MNMLNQYQFQWKLPIIAPFSQRHFRKILQKTVSCSQVIEYFIAIFTTYISLLFVYSILRVE